MKNFREAKWSKVNPIPLTSRDANSPWVKTWIGIEARCREGGPYYRYGRRNLITPFELQYLWFRDKAYLMKIPSIDREDNKSHYTLLNCRYIEKKDNSSRNLKELHKREDFKLIHLENLKILNEKQRNDPKYIAIIKERGRKIMEKIRKDPKAQVAYRKSMEKWHTDLKFRKTECENRRKLWLDPIYRAKTIKAQNEGRKRAMNVK